VHTGTVVVGRLGHDPQRLYTAIGETIHLATRLQRAAPLYGLLIGNATYQLVQAEVQGELWEAGVRSTMSLPQASIQYEVSSSVALGSPGGAPSPCSRADRR
jgi:class 3 adenylate cyclase